MKTTALALLLSLTAGPALAYKRGVVGEVAVLPGGSNGPNLPTKILSFSVASTTKNASHYAANFGFTLGGNGSVAG